MGGGGGKACDGLGGGWNLFPVLGLEYSTNWNDYRI
jgi:hypothetical protein